MEEPRVAAQGGEPGVVDGLVAAGVGFERRSARAPGQEIEEAIEDCGIVGL